MRKADTLCSKYWREKIGRCERCGSKDYLQLAHINTRSVRISRYSRFNTLVLCAGCHRWGHDHPTWFSEFVQKIKSPEDYKKIQSRKTESGISTIEFYKAVIEEYKKLISNL